VVMTVAQLMLYRISEDKGSALYDNRVVYLFMITVVIRILNGVMVMVPKPF